MRRSSGSNFPLIVNIVPRHWQTDCMTEPTSKFESITRRAPPTDKDAALAAGAGPGRMANSVVSGSGQAVVAGRRSDPVKQAAVADCAGCLPDNH